MQVLLSTFLRGSSAQCDLFSRYDRWGDLGVWVLFSPPWKFPIWKIPFLMSCEHLLTKKIRWKPVFTTLVVSLPSIPNRFQIERCKVGCHPATILSLFSWNISTYKRQLCFWMVRWLPIWNPQWKPRKKTRLLNHRDLVKAVYLRRYVRRKSGTINFKQPSSLLVIRRNETKFNIQIGE